MGKKISFSGGAAPPPPPPRDPPPPADVPPWALLSSPPPMDVIAEHFELAEAEPEAEPEDPRLGPGLYLDIDEALYHRDPGVRPTLSASIAKLIAVEAPLHAWAEHPRLGGGTPDAPTDAMVRGTAIHKLLLGRGKDFAVFGYDNWRTKAARQDRDQAYAEGKIPILGFMMASYEEMAAAYSRRIANLDPSTDVRLGEEQTEVVAIWEERGVLCRAMMDNLRSTDVTIDDLKTIVSVRPDFIERALQDQGADIQAVAYTSAIEHLLPEAQGRVRFRFLCMEASPPYDVVQYIPDPAFLELGRRRWARALDRWGACIDAHLAASAEVQKTDHYWPGHSRNPLLVTAPPWAIARDLDREMASIDVPPIHPF